MILGHHRPSTTVSRPDERGVIVPLTALSMIAVLLVATLVIDGSQAYPQRRTSQNAADNAALAGARALDKKKFFGGTEDVHAAATAVAQNNGSQLLNCWFITGAKTSTGVVQKSAVDPTCDPGDPVPADAYGVQVRTTTDRLTTFAGLNSLKKVQARAEAAASVQKLVSAGSPFIVCGNPASALVRPPGTRGFDILRSTGPATNPTFLYNADGSVDVDPAKVAGLNALNGNKGVPLVGSEVRVPRCGIDGGNFDGNGSNEIVSIPGWSSYVNGGGHDAAAAEQVLTASPCPEPFPSGGVEVLCDLILPIAIGSNPPANDKLRIVALGVFKVSGDGHGNPKYYGKYVTNASQVSGGLTTIGPVTAGSIRVIGLIQ